MTIHRIPSIKLSPFYDTIFAGGWCQPRGRSHITNMQCLIHLFLQDLTDPMLEDTWRQDMLRNTITHNWGQKDSAVEHRCNKLSYLSHFLSILAFINVCTLLRSVECNGLPSRPFWCTMAASVISPPGSGSIFTCSIFMYIGNLSGLLVYHKNLYVYY